MDEIAVGSELAGCDATSVGPDGRELPGAVVRALTIDARSRSEVLGHVARAASEPFPELDTSAIEEALRAREEQASTALGKGAAIPHASIEGLAHSVLLDVRLKRPVRWDEEGGEDVERCMVILVPPGEHAAHLELTAAAVQKLQEP